MDKQIILNAKQIELTIKRLCHELIESHNDFKDAVIIGLQPRGIQVVARLKSELEAILGHSIQCGNLDITFFRDDFRRSEKQRIPSVTNLDFSIENKKVVLVDDVLYTGRTIRAGLDALLTFGRPSKVELLVLIDRQFSRDLPIQPDYRGRTVDTLKMERVSVEWREIEGADQVSLYTKEGNE